MGLAAKALQEANELGEICFWNPNEKGRIMRTARIPDVRLGFSFLTLSLTHLRT